MMEKLFNEKEAAQYLNVSEEEIRNLVLKKKLSAYKIGGEFLRFTQHDLDAIKSFPALSGLAHAKKYSLLTRIKDYFYYNDFYIIVVVLILVLLALVFKVSF